MRRTLAALLLLAPLATACQQEELTCSIIPPNDLHKADYNPNSELGLGIWTFPDGTKGYAGQEDSTIWSDTRCINEFDIYSTCSYPSRLNGEC